MRVWLFDGLLFWREVSGSPPPSTTSCAQRTHRNTRTYNNTHGIAEMPGLSFPATHASISGCLPPSLGQTHRLKNGPTSPLNYVGLKTYWSEPKLRKKKNRAPGQSILATTYAHNIVIFYESVGPPELPVDRGRRNTLEWRSRPTSV